MLLMNKGKNKTLAVKRWENGLSLGLYGHLFGIASLEFADEDKEKIVLRISKDTCEHYGIEIEMVNDGWFEE